MNQLRLLTRCSHHADTGVISDASDAREAPQTAPFGMGLKDRVNCFGRDLTTIVEGVKRLAERLGAMGATVALRTLYSLYRAYGFSDDRTEDIPLGAIELNLSRFSKPTLH